MPSSPKARTWKPGSKAPRRKAKPAWMKAAAYKQKMNPNPLDCSHQFDDAGHCSKCAAHTFAATVNHDYYKERRQYGQD